MSNDTELDLSQEFVKVKIGDQKFDVRIPSNEESLDHKDTIESIMKDGNDTRKIIEASREYFSKLGLPSEECKKLSFSSIKKLSERLSGN